MHKRTWGLTLIELLITVVVLAILLTLAVPNVLETINKNRISTTANDIVSGINLARNEAVARSMTVGVCPTGTSDFSCTPGSNWNEGWLVWADANGDGDFDTGEEIRLSTESHSGQTSIAASGSLADGIEFNAGGTARNFGGSFEVTKGSAERCVRVTVNASGQIDTQCFKDKACTCECSDSSCP